MARLSVDCGLRFQRARYEVKRFGQLILLEIGETEKMQRFEAIRRSDENSAVDAFGFGEFVLTMRVHCLAQS